MQFRKRLLVIFTVLLYNKSYVVYSENLDEWRKDMANQGYVKPEDRYEELKGSAIMLIVTALAGYVFLILKALNILPLDFNGATIYMFYIVMGAMFTAFLLFGIKAMKDAKIAKNNIPVENNISKEVKEYFTEKCTAYEVDDAIGADTLSEGELYYKRYEYMTDIITSNFDVKDEKFIEHLLEEAYTILYPDNK